VIGYGYWGPNIVRNLSRLPACELRSVCDRSDEARRRVSELHPGIALHADAAAILGDPSIEAVFVVTPAATHGDLVRQALEAGKHVLVEKPLATSLAVARALVELAGRRERVLAVGHTFLYTAAVRAARAIVAAGTLGRVLGSVSRRENLGLHRPDADVIWDLAPHDVSILHHVVGRRIVRAAAIGADCVLPGTSDVASIVLEFEDGSRSFVQVSWLGARKVREIAWMGSRRFLVYDDTEPVEKLRLVDSGADVVMKRDGSTEVRYRRGDPTVVPLDSTEALERLCTSFLDAVAGRAPLEPDVGEALHVMAVLDALERSRRAGGSLAQVEDA
jgi:predicted dehydrogenase